MIVQHSAARRSRRSGGIGALTAGLDSLRGGFGAAAAVTTVNAVHVAAVLTTAQTNPIVRAVLEKVMTDTVDCSFAIKLRYGTDTIELPESEQHSIASVWPSFVRSVLWHLQVVGLVVVAADRATHMPRVVPLQYVRVLFRENARESRTYWVEELSGSNKRVDALVFIKYHPLAGSGVLTSPAASVLEHAERYERVLANQDDADFHATHPVWTFENDRNGAGRPTPFERDEFVNGEVYEQYATWHAGVANEVESTMKQSQQVATRSYDAIVDKAGRSAAVPVGAHAAPWLNNFFVPINQRLVPPPTPHANAHFTNELELIESKILQAFRVPPAVMETSHAMRYAAQPEMAMQQWGTTIRSMQRELSGMMADTYMFVASDLFAAYADAVLGRVATERAAAINAIETTSKSRAAAAAADAEPERSGPPALNDDGVLQLPETEESLQRAARILSVADADIVAHLRAKLSVVVEFHCRPMLQLPELQQLFAEGLISRDVYARQAAELLGMAASSFLVGTEAQEKDARERKRIADIMEPPDEQGGAGAKRPARSKA